MRFILLGFVLVIGHSFAGAQQPGQATGQQEAVPYSDLCLRRVASLIEGRKAMHDGPEKPGLKPVRPELAREIVRSGLRRGLLNITSYINPPSQYVIFQFASDTRLKPPDACPLDQTYLAFKQGGFAEQGTALFGPLE